MCALIAAMISREMLPYDAPRAASLASFLCLIFDHYMPRMSKIVKRRSSEAYSTRF